MSDNFDEQFDAYDDLDDDLDDLDDEVEAYCMTCKEKTPMDDPEAIWTRRGTPGTRGVCSICGTTVFRMGKTAAHASLKRPEPVQVTDAPRSRGGRRIASAVTYINYSVPDAEFAAILAEDLNRIGIQTWVPDENVDQVQWATGVHPALAECKQMIVILTPLAAKATAVSEAWQFFVRNRKPVFIVQLAPTEMPPELRTKPRFDFSGDDYKQTFRQLVQALAD
jgi:hypothetical protein